MEVQTQVSLFVALVPLQIYSTLAVATWHWKVILVGFLANVENTAIFFLNKVCNRNRHWRVPTSVFDQLIPGFICLWRYLWLDGVLQRGYSLYIEGHTLRTTKVLRHIGCSARHFRRNFASPAPSPGRDKTIDFRSIDHLIFFKN